MTTGPSAFITTPRARLSDIPCAHLARKLAVAGDTMTRSAQCASSKCGTVPEPRFQSGPHTGPPVATATASGLTRRVALKVRHARTVHPYHERSASAQVGSIVTELAPV